jgi:hypothetical protein
VVAVPVDLDDQASVPPDEVDLASFNADVRLGSRQAVVVAEREEALLELAACERGGVAGQQRL